MTTKRDRDKLKARVQAALKARGTTQKQLEADIGWSAGSLSRVYAGKRALDASEIETLAAYLGVPVAELAAGTTFGTGEPAAPPPKPRSKRAAAVAASPSPAPSAPESAPPESAPPESAPPGSADAPESAEAPESAAPAAEPPPPEATGAAGARQARKRRRDLLFRLIRWLVHAMFG